jgi:hypothetical protein
MSIDQHIKALVATGELFCLESEMFGDDTPRTLFLSEEVRRAVFKPFPAGHEVLHGEFRQELDAFLELSFIPVGEDPKTKEGHARMARVCPVEDEFFDFRITSPQPQIRAFGGFASKDTFVSVSWNYRDAIHEDFDAEVARCKVEWQKLFGTIKPFKGKTIHDYLTNCDPV